MSYSYDFSIVLFAKKESELKATLQSVEKLEYDRQRIQMILVALSGQVLSCDTTREIEKNNHAVIVDACGDDDISKLLSEKIRGEYVTFLKAGITYTPKALCHIRKASKSKSADVVFGAIKNRERINSMLHEHNVYCDRNHGRVSLEKDIRILHNMYFAYFLKAEKLRGRAEIVGSDWCIGVLENVYGTVLNAERVACTGNICLNTLNGAQAIAEWDGYIKSDSAREEFAAGFLNRLSRMVFEEGVLHRDNAEYILAYYCYRLAGLHNVAGTDADARTVKMVNTVLSKMRNATAIVQNRYIKQMYKHYILQNFFPEVKSEDSEETRFILRQEYKEVRFFFFEESEKKLHAEFAVLMPENETCEVRLDTGKEKISCEPAFEFQPVMWGQEKIGLYQMFFADVPWEQLGEKLCVETVTEDGAEQMRNLVFDRYTPLSYMVDLYYRAGGRLFWLTRERDAVLCRRDTWMRRAFLALRRTASFVATGKPGVKAVVARMLYHHRASRQQEKVWLLSDRTNRGDDNGEVMFRYLCENPVAGVQPYFVIDKNTPDWGELSKLGRLVEPFSREHKMLFLLNELSLSSQANKAVINPFGKLEYYYRDLMFDKKLVFLQHGITKDNQSAWLNKYNRNLFATIVTTGPEYDSMLEYDYHYPPQKIWLTGMPRYDRLYHDEKRYITIMPTWRKNLSPGTDENGVWLISDDFNRSAYFKFYNALLNDEKLLAAAREYDYTICFMPHPNTISALHMFTKQEEVLFFDMKKSYRDVFAQTDLMVTDYSSVAFDFAYLRKPIVYAQFDRESFFNGSHSYTEGYFNYETDGFGEVEYTLETVRERLVEYMATGCRLKPEYEKRINETFAFDDKDCCLRVCNKIEEYL